MSWHKKWYFLNYFFILQTNINVINNIGIINYVNAQCFRQCLISAKKQAYKIWGSKLTFKLFKIGDFYKNKRSTQSLYEPKKMKRVRFLMLVWQTFSVTNTQTRTKLDRRNYYDSILIPKIHLSQKIKKFKKVPFFKMKGTFFDNSWNNFDKFGNLLVRFPS